MIHVTRTGTRNKTVMDDFVNRPTAFSQFVTDDMEVIVVGDIAVAAGATTIWWLSGRMALR